MKNSCKIQIQIKKAGEETDIKDYYKYAINMTQEIDYKNLLTYWCDGVKANLKSIFIKKDGKEIKVFDLAGQPPQPYQKGVVYNEVVLTDEFAKMLGTDSKLTSWIYIECINL